MEQTSAHQHGMKYRRCKLKEYLPLSADASLRTFIESRLVDSKILVGDAMSVICGIFDSRSKSISDSTSKVVTTL